MTTDQVLPGFTLQVYDHKELFLTRVGKRKLIYLDHNVWIELRELKTADAVACLDACRAAVEAQQALFPLAFPAVTEAIEIPDSATRLRHADLLDALSNGVTFRSPRILMTLEARGAYRWLFKDETNLRIPREDAITSLPDHLGEGTMTFPPGFWTPDMAAKLVNDIVTDPRMRSVRFIAEQQDWHAAHAPMRAQYVQDMEEVKQRRLRDPQQPKPIASSIALQREREELFQQYVVPASRDALLAQVGPDGAAAAFKEVNARKGEGSRRRLKALFALLPVLDQRARILALDAMEATRRPQAQDFYDIEHGTVPPMYADAFVTRDNRLSRLVRGAGRGIAEILTTLPDLTRWIEVNCCL